MTLLIVELGSTLRAWRDRLSPAAAGLPSGWARRTPGLRREELAELSGISFDYLVRLEQGRSTSPSAPVAASLARALRLTSPERDHLYRLAGLVPPSDGQISDHIPPGLQRLLGRVGDSAAAVFAADWQLVWWNRAWAALLGDPSSTPSARRNFALDSFPVSNEPACLALWPVTSLAGDVVEAAIVSDLRRATGRFPHDKRLANLIEALNSGNQRFAELWASAAVGAHREDRKIVDHPTVGPITVDCDTLSDDDSDLKVVILTAEPGSEDETKLRLATITGAHGRALL